MIERCFYTGTLCECVTLGVDDGTQQFWTYLSKEVYESICHGDPDEAAELWGIVQTAQSAGYTDAGVLHAIMQFSDRENCPLYAVEITGEIGAAVARSLVAPGGDRNVHLAVAHPVGPSMFVLERTQYPVPGRLSSLCCSSLDCVTYSREITWIDSLCLPVQFIDGRLPPVLDERLRAACFNIAIRQDRLGFWHRFIESQPVGMELVRRWARQLYSET